MTWKPIETAPKDGSEFLACSQSGQVFLVWFSDMGYFIPIQPWILREWRDYGGIPFNTPVLHRLWKWMPLPSAPGGVA